MATFENSRFVSKDALNYTIKKINEKYVAKEEGKGLSTNDFTNELKAKLEASIVYEHPKSSVAPGTYTKVTVDEYGHVIAAENPTTLEGYGITDAAKIDHTHDAADLAQFVTSDEIDAMFAEASA